MGTLRVVHRVGKLFFPAFDDQTAIFASGIVFLIPLVFVVKEKTILEIPGGSIDRTLLIEFVAPY